MSKSVSASITVLALIGLVVAGCGGGGSNHSGIAIVNPAIYKISGTVTSSGNGLGGTTVMLDGAGNRSAVTDAFGNYSFCRVANGNYTVTPAKSNYSCTPKASVQAINGASIPNVNFTAAASSPLCYLVDDAGNLATVNVTSGAVQVIGNSGVVLTDIAFDQSGNLYGVSFNSLYAVNKSTAALTPIGMLHISGTNQNVIDVTSLVFSDTGTLYTANNYLYTVNTATGVSNVIGTGGAQYYSGGDLASVEGRMYVTSKAGTAVTNNDLIMLDTSTGKGTRIGAIGYPAVFGLASNDNIHLYGFSGTRAISIDTSTGAGTLLFDVSGQGLGTINGAAFY